MAAAQQGRKFTDEEAQRFAALLAGFDTCNPNEAEAINKVRVLRRMVIAKGMRVVDALELEEIRETVDRQLQPVRAAVKIVREMEYVNQGCNCEPWPARMFWFFVGVLAWAVTAIFWTLRQAWRVVVLAVVIHILREMWGDLFERRRRP